MYERKVENWNFRTRAGAISVAATEKVATLWTRSWDFAAKVFRSMFIISTPLLSSSESFSGSLFFLMTALQIFIWYDIPSGSIFIMWCSSSFRNNSDMRKTWTVLKWRRSVSKRLNCMKSFLFLFRIAGKPHDVARLENAISLKSCVRFRSDDAWECYCEKVNKMFCHEMIANALSACTDWDRLSTSTSKAEQIFAHRMYEKVSIRAITIWLRLCKVSWPFRNFSVSTFIGNRILGKNY